jgi:hypothetical protein
MSEGKAMSDERLDQLLNEIRNEPVSPAEVAGAQGRVLQRIHLLATLACAEFRPELSEYLADGMTESRRLLVEDHLSRCAGCRRAFAALQGEPQVVVMPAPKRAARPTWQWRGWAIAAGLAMVAAYLGRDGLDRAFAPAGPRATVISANGTLYRIDGAPLANGATLREAEVVRTGSGAHAMLRLADGSQVEMNERTELAVLAAWSGETVQLQRGDVIVQAAKQTRGSLRVRTRDSVASVKGTIFAVSTGSAGTLVSVVEGAVLVDQPGSEKLLKPGQDASSSPVLADVSVRQAVSWSENADKYYALLGEFASLARKISAIPSPEQRTESKLLQYLPAGVVLYAAIPNLGGTVKQAQAIIEQQAAQSPVLKEWWSSKSAEAPKKMMASLESLSPSLGDEVVFVLAQDAQRKGAQLPLLIAQITPGRETALKQALDQLPEAGTHPFAFSLNNGLLLASDSPEHLATLSGQLGQGAASPFAVEIARHYAHGTRWLFALDLAGMNLAAKSGADLSLLGVDQMKYAFFEQRTEQGVEGNEAVLTFQGPRKGLSSWLAAPGGAGSSDYISSDALLAASASTRDPRRSFEELVGLAGQVSSQLLESLNSFEQASGIRVGDDLAAALGTDFSLAVEQPTLPLPGWVAVLEVVNPTLFDSTMRRLVERFNHDPKFAGSHQLSLAEEAEGGRAWMTLRAAGMPLALHWTYDRGYLLITMDRAIALKAIATRTGDLSLPRSAAFQQQMPPGFGVHYSGFLWVNTSGVLTPFASLSPNPALKKLLESREPVLIVADAEAERIRAASRTTITSLVLDMMALSGSAPSAHGRKM